MHFKKFNRQLIKETQKENKHIKSTSLIKKNDISPNYFQMIITIKSPPHFGKVVVKWVFSHTDSET